MIPEVPSALKSSMFVKNTGVRKEENIKKKGRSKNGTF